MHSSVKISARSALEQYIAHNISKPINVADWESEHQALLSSDPHAGEISQDFFIELFSQLGAAQGVSSRGISISHLHRPNLSLDILFLTLAFPLRIENSTFKEVNIQGVSAKASLAFIGCATEQMSIRNIEADDDLDVRGSNSKRLVLENNIVHGDLLLSRGHHNNIELHGLKLSGDLMLEGLTGVSFKISVPHVDGEMVMNGIKVRNLFINGGRVGGNIAIRDAEIDSGITIKNIDILGLVNVESSKIKLVYLSSIHIKGDLFFTKGCVIEKVSLFGGEYGSLVSIVDCVINGDIDMQRVEVAGSVFLRKSQIRGDLDLSYSLIQNSVALEGLKIEGRGHDIDFTGAVINGDLRFHQTKYEMIPWGDQTLRLRNCTVHSFQDHPDIWPTNVDFTNFSYTYISGRDRIKGTEQQSCVEFTDRKVKWMIGLLAKQKNFSPQPYWQLARVLAQLGHEKKATRILYECAKIRRRKVPNFFSRQFKLLHFALNGYGYYNSRVLYWAVLFTLCGVFVLQNTGELQRLQLGNGFLYSLDKLIPVIELNAKYYSKTHVLENPTAEVYFVFHQLMGYVLALMAISGLNKIAREER